MKLWPDFDQQLKSSPDEGDVLRQAQINFINRKDFADPYPTSETLTSNDI